jgi:rhamnose transport system ATP-binding protein
MQTILEMKDISKVFPGVKALDGVSFDLREGEIHALMGENGAGKSTLIKVLTGVHQPTKGEIYLRGEKVSINNPIDAQKLGISAVYQHVTCYPDLSITENIFMEHELLLPRTKQYDWKRMHKLAMVHLQKLGMNIDSRTTMGTLSIAKQQIVEIAKAVSTNAKILIMDEPTAALSKTECDELYAIIRTLVKEGSSIILISHRTEDIFSLADRVSVFRDARYIGTWAIGDITLQELSKAMVGRDLNLIFPPSKNDIGEELFRASGLSKKGFFQDISFTVHQGEIVALTGLVGAGRTEVCQAIYGILSLDAGKMYIKNKLIHANSPSAANRHGIAYLPEDRQSQGLILKWGVDQNITLSNLSAFAALKVFLRRKSETETATKLISKLNIKVNSPDDPAESLSGGNQQKTVFAKILCKSMKLLILDEPTKGVDVGAKAQIYGIMRDLTKEGYGILLVSSEMNEVLGMSDRIYVMRSGRIMSCMSKENATSEKILADAMLRKTGEE